MNLEENERLAELIGIILGDGNLFDNGRHYVLGISLNYVRDAEYVNYVRDLIKNVFNIDPKLNYRKQSHQVEIRVFRKEVVFALVSKGLKTGDKIRNQIGVPEWILNNRTYVLACLRGLIDTDGSIFLNKHNKIIGINFKNTSIPLITDFKIMCQKLGIKTSVITRNEKLRKGYKISIQSKNEVAKFLYTLKPKRWIHHFRDLINILNKYEIIFEDLFKYKREKCLRFYPKKLIHEIKEAFPQFF